MTSQLAPSWLNPPREGGELVAHLWPVGTKRNTDGAIVVGGVSTTELAERFGTPLYVVDEHHVRTRATAIRTALEGATAKSGTTGIVYYAGKALLTGAIVRWMAEEGLRIDVATLGELELALAAGANPARIGVHGNNKSDEEIVRAISVGVGSLVLDSAQEVARVDAAARASGVVQPVRIRVNSGVHASTHEYLATAREDQKFGVALTDVPEIVADIRSRSGLKFLGLHSHIGSQIVDSAGFEEAARRLLDVHATLLAEGDVPELNLGGGFGVPYTRADLPNDVPALVENLVDRVAELCRERGIPVPVIAIEPGRSIVATAGITLYRTGEIKPVEVAGDGASGTRTYVSVDGGMSDNLRTALYAADYSVSLASRSSDETPMLVRVVGRHCESGDIVVRDDYLPGDLSAGDILAVPVTGAYCYSLSNNYNGVPRPAVVAVNDGNATVIVRRETISEVYSRDTQLERPIS